MAMGHDNGHVVSFDGHNNDDLHCNGSIGCQREVMAMGLRDWRVFDDGLGREGLYMKVFILYCAVPFLEPWEDEVVRSHWRVLFEV